MELPKLSLNREPPTCIAIVLCGEVIEDKRTSNRTLIHLFNTITAPRLPVRQPALCVLYSLTDGRGQWTVRLTIDTPSGQTLFQADNHITFHDPLATVDFVAEILGLPLAEAGEYRIELACGHRPLGSRRFRVVEQASAESPHGAAPGA